MINYTYIYLIIYELWVSTFTHNIILNFLLYNQMITFLKSSKSGQSIKSLFVTKLVSSINLITV